ncbi:MAG: sigma-54-dependent transcriptional regulator [Acidobacteriota bacterium]
MTRTARILLIDDDAAGRNALRRALEKQGYRVEAHPAGAPAVARLEGGEEFDLVITDLRMPEMDGLQVLERVRQLDPELPVILITGFGTIENAVEAMHLGARDYLTKPLDLFEVRSKVGKALEASRLALENRYLSDENRRLRRQLAPAGRGVKALMGDSLATQNLRKRILQVAPTHSSVLIIGASGTGKELIARAIHEESGRSRKVFLPINCAAIPKDILESELFGHERGAFTGATGRKPGKFEVANGGTLFLDEIGELPLDMQAKLLRVLEEKSFMRVGGVQTVQVDVRIVAATNADLDDLVARNQFRTDLYYRLKVVTLEVPPLNTRVEDIPVLVRHFLGLLAEEYQRPGLTMTPDALDVLLRQRWPGNVRELRNLLESLVVLNPGPNLDRSSLPPEYGGTEEPIPVVEPPTPVLAGVRPPAGNAPGPAPGPWPEPDPLGLSMAEMEKRHILRTLEEHGQNRTRAAKVLGIGRRTLQRKLEEYKDQGEEIPPGASD